MSSYPITRDTIIEALKKGLEPLEFVRAAWLGGSDATGRTDAWSDVDLLLIVEDGMVQEAARAVTRTLRSLSPIAHRHRLPEPTPHGHFQEFVCLRDTDPCHLVDYVVMERSSTNWFLEPERHGRQRVLFDKDALVTPAPFDRAAHEAMMARRLGVLREVFPLFQGFVIKAVLRNDLPDAWSAYFACTVRPLVELARMRYCPDRFDFGFRYLDRDLPEEVRRAIESLLLPRSIEEIEVLRDRAEVLFNRLLADMQGEAPVPHPAPRTR